MLPDKYTSVLNTVHELQARGFISDFNFVNDRLFCSQSKDFATSDQFDILEIYTFDDDIRGNYEIVLYAIEWLTTGVKGILMDDRSGIASRLTHKLTRFWK